MSNKKYNKYVGTYSTRQIKDTVWETLLLFMHVWPNNWPINYFRDVRQKSGFIRYKLMFHEFNNIQLRELQKRLPEAEVKAWQTQKWALGRGRMVITIKVPLKEVVESELNQLRRKRLEGYKELAKLGRWC